MEECYFFLEKIGSDNINIHENINYNILSSAESSAESSDDYTDNEINNTADYINSLMDYFSDFGSMVRRNINFNFDDIAIDFGAIDMDFNRAVTVSMRENKPKSKPLSENKIKKLKTTIFKNTEKIYNQCSICMDNFKDNDKIIILGCNHYYHKKCICKWFKKYNNFCPICKNKKI